MLHASLLNRFLENICHVYLESLQILKSFMKWSISVAAFVNVNVKQKISASVIE